MGQGILWGPLVLFAMVMSFTPGPNVVMVTASAANFGFRRVIPHMIGITLGFGLLIVAAGIGLSGLFQAEPRLHTVLKYGGAAYLLYLAWRISQNGPTKSNSSSRGRPINFVEAVLFQWINPKGWIMAVGALAAYTVEGSDAFIATILITMVLATTCLSSVVIWAGFGTVIGKVLGDSRFRMAFNWSMAALLVLSLIPVLRE